ncbi:MAG: DUF401 family protein [Pyrodictiaceae archaeon]
MIVNSFIGFIAGYAALTILSIRYRNAVIAIAAMILVYYVLSTNPFDIIGALFILLSWNDLRVFVFIFLSIFLAGVLREKGILNMLVESTSSLGCRFSLLSVPALIGLLPMPGGALVSAIAMKDKYLKDARLSPEWATFLNYWFRHIWVPSWPLFQSIIITASVFSIEPSLIVIHTWPATIAVIIGGLIVALATLIHTRCSSEASLGLFVKSIWPFIVLALLVFLAKIPLLEALIITILVVLVVLRPGERELVGALRLATKPTIHAVLFEALLFKDLLLVSQGPRTIMGVLTSLGLSQPLLVYLIPFILGLSAGGENFFAATAMPLLSTMIKTADGINWRLLYLAYSGGFLGVMLSPVHLCLVLTLEYYRADMSKTMAMVFAAVLISILFTYFMYIGFNVINQG